MRQIGKLPRDTGVTGWNAILGPAFAYPEAEGEISADWLVIGGGFAGLAAAKRLTVQRASSEQAEQVPSPPPLPPPLAQPLSQPSTQP